MLLTYIGPCVDLRVLKGVTITGGGISQFEG